MIVVDTSILVYAVGTPHRYAEPSRRLMDAAAEGRVAVTTTFGVIEEFLHVRARRRDRREAVVLARNYARFLAPLLAVGEEQLERGLRLFERHGKIGAFDAILAATALVHRAEAFVSGDAGFASIPGLSYVEPTGENVDQLIRI